MYLLSDGIYFLIYYVVGYRKQMVFNHLKHTFPDKTDKELVEISKKFFRNFCDVWVEMIKNLSLTEKQALRRLTCDFSLFEQWYKTGKSIQIIGGHFINWEYLPVALPIAQPYTALAIFMPLSNKVLDRLVFKLRSRFGLVLLRAGNMQHEMEPWHKKQYMMVVGADQSPSNPDHSYWLNFCNRPTGFIKGPWIRAIRQDQPYIYLSIRKTKRGHYTFKASPFSDDPAQSSPAALALNYARMLEDDIRQVPELYLWTHNRWKRPWKAEYRSKWIDTSPPPAIN
jgi:Kdo2-lipid IVA lauroyltransferase/acyltransferase